MRLVLELDGPAPPSGELGGRVIVVEGGEHRQLRVAIRLCEHSRDYHEEITYAHAILAPAGQLREGESFPFTLTVPAQAGPPIHTEWAGLGWEVRAWADLARQRDPEVTQALPLAQP